MNRNRKTRSIPICALVVAFIVIIVGNDAKADFVFGELANLGPTLNTSFHDGTPSISSFINRTKGFLEEKLHAAYNQPINRVRPK